MLILTRWFTDRERYRSIPEGARLPKGYGFVSYDPALHRMLVARIPMNFVLAWLRRLWLKLQAGSRNQEILWAYNLGYSDGRANRDRAELLAEMKRIIDNRGKLDAS